MLPIKSSRKIGFTGTSGVVSIPQLTTFEHLIVGETDIWDELEFHHGDCIGADAKADAIVRQYSKYKIHIHPPVNAVARAWCCGAGTIMYPEKPYLDRNKDIVDATDFLVAMPAGPEALRSGTWSTVRYARKKQKKILIIRPDGSVKIE